MEEFAKLRGEVSPGADQEDECFKASGILSIAG